MALPKLAKGPVLHALASLGDDEPISPILCSILQVDPPSFPYHNGTKNFMKLKLFVCFCGKLYRGINEHHSVGLAKLPFICWNPL